MPSSPTQEDAKLLLQLYDLRRERRLRRARDFVQQDCKFKDYKDFTRRYPEGSKERAYVGMVLGYWDMACTLVAKGLIDEDLFNSANFEHVAVWFKLKPLAEAWRAEFKYSGIMASLEAVAGRHPAAAQHQPRVPAKEPAKPAAKTVAIGRRRAKEKKKR